MLKLRVIPILLWDGINLIKGIGFNKERKIDSLLPAIRVFNNRLVDELVLFDVTATTSNRGPDLEAVRLASQHLFVPLTVGGGIKSLDHIHELFRSGADKVCLNSVLYDDLSVLEKAAAVFGSQSVVAAIDFKRDKDNFYCVRNAGTVPLVVSVIDWARDVENAGAGEIILTSIDRDGTFSGYELELLYQLKDKLSVPLIISGGFGTPADALLAIEAANVAGFGIGSAFFFTEQTPATVRNFLGAANQPVRMVDISN